jgi:phospholipid/cholesterol/gamma-HCH transport system permease protein
MIPGCDQDGAAHFFRAQQFDGEFGILPRGLGLAFDLNCPHRNPRLDQKLPVDFIVTLAGDDDAGRGFFLEQFRCAQRPFVRATTQDNNHIGLRYPAVHGQNVLGKEVSGGNQQNHQQNETGRGFKHDFSHTRENYVKLPSGASPKPSNPTLAYGCCFVILHPVINLLFKHRFNYVLSELGQIAFLARDILLSLLTFKIKWRDLLYQIYSIGVKSQSVVIITGAFTGMVLGAQTYFQFHKVKMDTATLAVVSVSLCDELGPVLTALMVAGRVGASIAAEIGTMRVTEQIDALRTLATHPVDYLVVPRILAAHLTLPLLAVEAIVIGIFSSYLVCVHILGIEPVYLWENMLRYTHDVDIVIGVVKAFIFGGIIALIGCYKGLTCGLGAEGVGLATTEAVVYSSITILVTNFFLTLVMGKLVGLL